MPVEKTYRLESLRAKLISGGYEITDEKPVQGGVQLLCACGAKPTVFSTTGTVIAQGKNAPVLENFLNSDAGELNLFAKNRMFILYSERHLDAKYIGEQMHASDLRPVLLDLGNIDDDDYKRSVRENRPFSACAVFIGTYEEFSENAVFSDYLREMALVLGANRILCLSPTKLSEKSALEVGNQTYEYEPGRMHLIWPRLFTDLLYSLDKYTHQLVVRHRDRKR